MLQSRAARIMRVALIYPPSYDPTAPYLSVPTLTGFLRANGVDVIPLDANVEAWDDRLTKSSMTKTREGRGTSRDSFSPRS